MDEHENDDLEKDIGKMIYAIVTSVFEDFETIRSGNIQRVKENFRRAREREVEEFVKGKPYLTKADKEKLLVIGHRWDVYDSALRIFDVTLSSELRTYREMMLDPKQGVISQEFFEGKGIDVAEEVNSEIEIEKITQEITKKLKGE